VFYYAAMEWNEVSLYKWNEVEFQYIKLLYIML